MPFYNVNSNAYLVVFFVFALFESLISSGIVYGWASIVVVFKLEYFFLDLCEGWNQKNNRTFAENVLIKDSHTIVSIGAVIVDNTLPGCSDQDARLNLIFTISLFFLCCIKFPAGIFIDKYGPRIARIFGGTIYLISVFGLGLVVIGNENLLFAIFPLLAMGGSLLAVSMYQVSNIAYRKYKSRVMCILHGSFDSSSVVMLIFKLLYDAGIPFKNIIRVYGSICAVTIIVSTALLCPPLKVLYGWVEEEKQLRGFFVETKALECNIEKSIDNSLYAQNEGTINAAPSDLGEEEDERKLCLSLTDSEELTLNNAEETDKRPSLDGNPVESESVLKSIFSRLYLFELMYLMIFQLKLWYYVGTLVMFLTRLTGFNKEQVSTYVNIFGYVQFGGIFVTPIVGLIFDKDSICKADETLIVSQDEASLQSLRRCIAPFVAANLLCVAFCIVSSIDHLQLQILSFILYMIVRGFLYSNHGAYMGIAFPPSQFGTLYGLGFLVGGSFGVLQYPLFELTMSYLNNDPFWVNMFLLGLVLFANIHPIYLWWFCRKEAKRLSAR